MLTYSTIAVGVARNIPTRSSAWPARAGVDGIIFNEKRKCRGSDSKDSDSHDG